MIYCSSLSIYSGARRLINTFFIILYNKIEKILIDNFSVFNEIFSFYVQLVISCFTSKNRFSSGVEVNETLLMGIGMTVFDPTENSKLFNRVTSPMRICIIPMRMPIQLRGPSPNGNHSIEFRLVFWSLVNRSGSNLSGFG